ncbi:MAG: hypothetical protein HWE09_07315 [Cyclobacteriaceae bacterium]|nr:hypothetical protein [Cyclobacteriaceae bacterium]
MDFFKIAEKIIELKEKDDKLRAKLEEKRTLSNGYNKQMEALHNENTKELKLIMEKIGFPTFDKVGEEASNAAWLIIQHSIGQPDFMKEAARLLEIAVNENKADPKCLAYLTDRIAVFEGRPQLYGTQFDWDQNGQMSPNKYDDLLKVNERRKAIGLNSIEEQIEIIQKRIKNENQCPPKNFEERNREYEMWRKSAGWIK